MTALLSLALVLLGAHLALRTVAALYRIIDLWYGWERYWPLMVRGVVGWGGAMVVTARLLPDRFRSAFLGGAAGFVLFYLAMYFVRYPLLRRRERP